MSKEKENVEELDVKNDGTNIKKTEEQTGNSKNFDDIFKDISENHPIRKKYQDLESQLVHLQKELSFSNFKFKDSEDKFNKLARQYVIIQNDLKNDKESNQKKIINTLISIADMLFLAKTFNLNEKIDDIVKEMKTLNEITTIKSLLSSYDGAIQTTYQRVLELLRQNNIECIFNNFGDKFDSILHTATGTIGFETLKLEEKKIIEESIEKHSSSEILIKIYSPAYKSIIGNQIIKSANVILLKKSD